MKRESNCVTALSRREKLNLMLGRTSASVLTCSCVMTPSIASAILYGLPKVLVWEFVMYVCRQSGDGSLVEPSRLGESSLVIHLVRDLRRAVNLYKYFTLFCKSGTFETLDTFFLS